MFAFNIGFVIFPQLRQLDSLGPLQVLARLPDSATHIIAKSSDPAPSDCGLNLVPTCTFASCPSLDLICLPGGSTGAADVLRDSETIEFVRRQPSGDTYITSVCTRAFVLGAVGLLRGRKATTHWAFRDLLPVVGATHVRSRVVRDGNLITAGGVTPRASTLASRSRRSWPASSSRRASSSASSTIPAPPFEAGHPDWAPAAAKDKVSDRYGRMQDLFRERMERQKVG